MARFERRAFMSMMGKMAVALPFARVGAGAQSAPRAQPNILFILADDLGYADLSSYGRRDIATPNIDRIGTEGVRFLQAYANSAVCSATRTALITGRYQYRLRLGLEEPARDVPDIGLPPEHPTLPSLLKKAGYRTALVGKWHLGSLPKFGPLQSGYEQFYGFRGGGVDYYTHANGSRKDFWDGDTPIEKQGYLTDLLGERTIELIDAFAKGKAPFFISLHFNAPHWPWEPPGDDSESKRLHGQNLMHMDGGSLAIYKQMVERMDYQVGRVLAALDAHGLRDDTIVIFTSDNGGERFSDTWPFTGKKSELLEGGVRVPAMVRWPRRVAPGRTHDQVTISMDWLPTLLAAAGTAPDPEYPTDGMSLMPVLTHNAPAVPRKLFWRYKANAQRSARDGDFKILKIQNHTFLFNVVEDPLERANLRERRRDIYDRMVREWNEWNATMLPETRDSATYNWSGADIADHFGSEPATGEVDDVSVWPDARASAPGSK